MGACENRGVKSLVVIHASPAAVDPVRRYFLEHGREWLVTNLLDDGVMRTLATQPEACGARLAEMIAEARRVYGAGFVLLTCSAVPGGVMEELRRGAGVPVLKIDEPMCGAAVRAGGRIGVLSSFPATRETTRRLLEEAAAGAGCEVELVEALEAEALRRLIDGDVAGHDRLIEEAAVGLVAAGAERIVLAQVSMARNAARVRELTGVPVFESLSTSFAAVRAAWTHDGQGG